MKKLLIVFSVTLAAVLGCAELQSAHRKADNALQASDEVADKLQSSIDIAQAGFNAVAPQIEGICAQESFGVCKSLMRSRDAAETSLSIAQSAVDNYRRTGQGFKEALNAIAKAVDAVVQLKDMISVAAPH